MALIITEGMDNAGKSTLIQSLAEEFRLPTARTYKKPNSSLEIHQWDAWAHHCPEHLILDRHPAISDFIYGPLLRGVTYSGLALAQNVSERAYLVYCRPASAFIHATMHERDQLAGVAENTDKLIALYDNLMEDLKPDFVYDYTVEGQYDKLVKSLTEFLGRL